MSNNGVYMWNSEKWKKVIVVLIIIAFVALFAGGWIYYTFLYPQRLWECLLMTLQNCMESLLFNPVLPIQDIFNNSVFMSSVNLSKKVILHLYSAAMVLAPLVDILIIFSILDSFLGFFAEFTWKSRKILIVGYNEEVRQLLERTFKNGKVYLWTDQLLPDEEKRDLFMRKVSVRINDFSLGDSPEEYEKQKRSFNRFFKNKEITDVLLLDHADVKNMQYYMALSSCEVCTYRTIHFFVLCRDFGVRNMLQDYFDQKLQDFLDSIPKENKNDSENPDTRTNTIIPKDTHMDLRIFNYDQIQAERLFFELPILHETNNTEKDVHLLIVGDDDLAIQTTLQAMNQAVFSANNKIVIDIISSDFSYLKKCLDLRLSKGVSDRDDHSYLINSEVADGQLKIRLFNCNLTDSRFITLVKRLHENEGAISYIALLSREAKENLYAFINIADNIVIGSEITEGAPIAVRITYTPEMEGYLSSYKGEKKVCLFGINKEYIGLDQIINIEEEKNIRIYNAKYEEIGNNGKFDQNSPQKRTEGNADLLWNRLPYYKRESNRALYNHKPVKEILFEHSKKKEDIKQEMKAFWESQKNETIASEKSQESGSIASEKKEENGKKDNKENTKIQKWSACLISLDEKDRYVYPNLIDSAKIEHRRFEYFHISEGWGYADKKDSENRLHDCLCPWTKLKDDNNKKSVLIYDLISSPLLMDEKYCN